LDLDQQKEDITMTTIFRFYGATAGLFDALAWVQTRNLIMASVPRRHRADAIDGFDIVADWFMMRRIKKATTCR
jgi:hypothetical protein